MKAATVRVQVCYALAPGRLDISPLTLPEGSTLSDAIQASGLLQRQPEAAALATGIWGRKQPGETRLREGDRVEVYRPLQCDPKAARRLRYRQRAEKVAGKGVDKAAEAVAATSAIKPGL